MAYISTPESGILDGVCEYLHLKGYFFFRVNNTGVFDTAKKIHRAMPKWGLKGVSDIILVWKGQVFFIEVKTKTGRQSPNQKAFQAMVETNGCDYYIVRSIDDIQRFFPQHA